MNDMKLARSESQVLHLVELAKWVFGVGYIRGQARSKGRISELDRELSLEQNKEDEFSKFASQGIQFLDSLDRIVTMARQREQTDEMSGWFRSVEALQRRVLRLFEKFELKMIDSIGEPVDFDRHEVFAIRETDEAPHDTIIEEIQKSVVFRGKVIRDAKVIVAANIRDEEPDNQ